MKKILSTVVALIAIIIPASLRAQEQPTDYNMVITLQNGTTITLGHNDIKNITFNGEEISITGNAANSIDSLRSAIRDNSSRIDHLQMDVAQIYYDLRDQIDYTHYTLDILNDSLTLLRKKLADHISAGGSTDDNHLAERLAALEDLSHELIARIDKGEMYTYTLENMINILQIQIDTNRVDMDGHTSNLDAKVTELGTRIETNDARTIILESYVSSLQSQIDELKSQLNK